MSELPSTPGEKMGTTRLLLLLETRIITQLLGIFMPDQSGPGVTTTALSIDGRQDGNVKYATDAHSVNHNATQC